MTLGLDSGWSADLDTTDVIIEPPKETAELLATCKVNIGS